MLQFRDISTVLFLFRVRVRALSNVPLSMRVCARAGRFLVVAQWLSNISEADAGRPPLSNTGTTVRIVENWEAPKDPEASARTIHVYTNAPLGERALHQ